jgi:NADH-quinone oxidoreductase subunit M
MQIPYLLQIIVVPLAFIPIAYVAGLKFGKYAGWITAIPLAYTVCLILLAIPKGSVYEEYVWAPLMDLKFGLLADGVSTPILFTIALLCMLVAVYSIQYMEHRIYEEYKRPNNAAHATYYILYLLYAVGMMGTVLATNLFEFYMFYELMLVPSWALIYLYGYGERERIALMYFLWTHAGALSLLAGIFLIYAKLGSLKIIDISHLVHDPIALWVIVLVLIGFFVKLAAFGFHIWLPYAHAEAPTPISALLSPAMIGIGAYAVIRIIILPLLEVFEKISLLIAIWGLLTTVYGGLLVLAQDDIKRLLAYSSISQMGYLITGIASATTIGVTGTLFHYVSHGLGKCLLFAVAGILICQAHGIRSIRRLGGLASKMPITTIAFVLGFLTIAGAPPLIGFQSKLLIFEGAIEGGIHWGLTKLIVAILALFATMITVAYALWTIWRVFFGPLPKHLKDVKEAPSMMTTPLLILAVISILLGVYPKPIVELIIPAINEFMQIPTIH